MPRYKIPGVTGKRVPGRGNPPKIKGKHLTRVEFKGSSGGNRGSAIFREAHHQRLRNIRGQFAGGMGFAWQGLTEIGIELEQWEGDLLSAVESVAYEMAAEMEEWAKENAPWQDDTGAARDGLQTAVIREPNGTFSIWLGHGDEIYYGIWLEVRWGGKYAIILPTIHQFAPQFGGRVKAAT